MKSLFGFEERDSVAKLKGMLHILTAVLMAVTAGGLVWYYININTPSVRVLVAAEKLPIGKVLDPACVIYKDFPKIMVPEGAKKSISEVTDKTVVSGTLFPGDIIRDVHITEETGSLKAILDSLAPGREAVDLPEDTSPGLSGVARGDCIKVFTEVTVGKDVTIVESVAMDSVVLKTPQDGLNNANNEGRFVVAVTTEESRKIAEGIVLGKRFSISLLPKEAKQ